MSQPIVEVSGINMSLVVTRTPAAGDDEFIIQVLLPDGQRIELFARQAQALGTALKLMTGDSITPQELTADPDLRIYSEGD
ncbi:hypothetical protein HR12_23455 [Microbacterium sp. SUBG005]|nr:hypothetical protein HR12_39960 [Microbacterium sp. SUBG005]KEP75768.1 hypothetical protein HR12_23455 [Microbacterium sp. SUBG005]